MIYFITSNKNKFAEAKAILPEVEQLDINLPEIQEIDAKEVIRKKLLEGLNHSQKELIVEDTSLYLDSLKGLPGPLVKWFLKTIGNIGLFEIAAKLGNDKAEAKTIVGYAKNQEEIYYFTGVMRGKVVKPKGKFNFGWDPIFLPDGQEKTFAEMSREEKNNISMRRNAFCQLKEFLAAK